MIIYLIILTTAAAASPAAATAARLLFSLSCAATAVTPLKLARHINNTTHQHKKADVEINLVIQTLRPQSVHSNLWGQRR